MPSSSDLDALARRRVRRALLAAAAAIIVLIAVVTLLLPRLGGTTPPVAAPFSSAPPVAAPSDATGQTPAPPQSSPQASAAAGQRYASLPKPGDYLDGLYPVSFPHTSAGAAAAAAAMYQYIWTVDPGQAARVVDVYITTEDRPTSRRSAAESVRALRQRMGLPPTGEVPASATIAVQPIGVQWRMVDADNVYASIAMRIDMLPGNGRQLRTAPAASTAHMQWRSSVRGGDWVALQSPASTMPNPGYAEPGTPAFARQGWRAIRPGG
jgi:hypothetical protein